MSGINRWIPVPADGLLEQDDADAVTGCDLWVCLETDQGQVVGRAHYFQGADQGFHGNGVRLRNVTHYWIRDRKPATPSRFEELRRERDAEYFADLREHEDLRESDDDG